MKRLPAVVLLTLSTGLLLVDAAFSQGLFQNLNIQGLDRPFFLSARSRGMGGTSASLTGDASAVFANPAALSGLRGIEFRAGGSFTSTTVEQKQEWIPDRRYAGLSIMFENDFTGIKDSALQKPFDDITPSWEHTRKSNKPTLLAGAMPLVIGGMRAAVALGGFQAADLDYYFQNNNVMDPNIGSFRPAPIFVPQLGDTIGIEWYQSISERSGALYGITPGFSIELAQGLSIGLSATIAVGEAEDTELRVDRGYLRLTTNSSGSHNVFFVDPVADRVTTVTQSDFSGFSLNIGGLWRQEFFSIGLTLRPPSTITRDWDRSVTTDTAGQVTVAAAQGSDEIQYPFQYALGLTIHASDAWDVSIDYGVGANTELTYATADSSYRPWVGGPAFRFGAEYRALEWLSLRAGYREEVQTFASEGSGLLTEPVRGSAFSFGAGLVVGALGVDLSYEFGTLEYQDLWISNINTNTRTTHRLTGELFVRL